MKSEDNPAQDADGWTRPERRRVLPRAPIETVDAVRRCFRSLRKVEGTRRQTDDFLSGLIALRRGVEGQLKREDDPARERMFLSIIDDLDGLGEVAFDDWPAAFAPAWNVPEGV